MSDLNLLIWFLEIAYTVLWSMSFYFQIYTIYKTKTGDGYSLDYQWLNLPGYAYYSGYNIYDYLHNSTKAEGITDMIYAVHGFCITIFIICQTYCYPRQLNKFSLSSKLVILIILVSSVAFIILNETICRLILFLIPAL